MTQSLAMTKSLYTGSQLKACSGAESLNWHWSVCSQQYNDYNITSELFLVIRK